MPLLLIPIILGLGAAVGIGTSVKNVVDGHDDREYAESIANNAKSLFKSQETRLKNTRELLYTDAAEYGRFAYQTKEKIFGRFVAISKTIGKAVTFSDIKENTSEAIDVETKIEDFHKDATNASEVLGTLGTATAASVGAGLAVGPSVAAAAGLFGTASTGAAIGSLGGAAATNATLAWLGGGALAAGGGGMAAGALVLGGITCAAFTIPAALIGSWSYKAKGEEMYTQACRYSADIEIEIEKMRSIQKFLKSVRKQIQETQQVIGQLSTFAEQQMNVVEQTIKTTKKTKVYKQDNVLVPYTLAYHLCTGIKEILDTNILDAEGNFNEEIPQILQKHKKEVTHE